MRIRGRDKEEQEEEEEEEEEKQEQEQQEEQEEEEEERKEEGEGEGEGRRWYPMSNMRSASSSTKKVTRFIFACFSLIISISNIQPFNKHIYMLHSDFFPFPNQRQTNNQRKRNRHLVK